MSLYQSTIPQLTQMLTNMDRWLENAVAFADKKKFDPNILASARLAPDQYPLTRQIQAACDAAKNLGARLTAQEPPKHPDTEQTISELRARVAKCKDYLQSLKAEQFAGADKRVVPLPFMEGKGLEGTDYVCQLALPNFYFHATTAYAILRHNGVDLGKADFIGSLNLRDLK